MFLKKVQKALASQFEIDEDQITLDTNIVDDGS